MRTTILALVALAFLRTVLGLHFFLEGVSHLRDPAWSSAGSWCRSTSTVSMQAWKSSLCLISG